MVCSGVGTLNVSVRVVLSAGLKPRGSMLDLARPAFEHMTMY